MTSEIHIQPLVKLSGALEIGHISFCGRVPWLYQYWPGMYSEQCFAAMYAFPVCLIAYRVQIKQVL